VGCGELGDGEHPGCAEALAAAAQPVGADDVVDDEPVEGLAGAADHALLVEDAGDLACGVPVEQFVDGGEDLGGGSPLVPDEQGRRDGEGAVLAAGQADMRGDGVADPGDGDVGEQQPGDALAFPLGGGGVVPDGGQVGSELADAGLLRVGELAGVLAAGLVAGLLRVAERSQGGVPVGFEGGGDQPVVGVDGQVAAAGQVSVILGALDVGGAQCVGFVCPVL